MFEAQLFEAIIQVWEADQRYRGGKQKTPPEINLVRAVVETAFGASLKQEEGRPISFGIALMSDADVEEERRHPYAPIQITMTFDNALPLTVESVAKLATAFDPNTTALLAAPDSRGQSNVIWGAMFFGPTANRVTEMPVGGQGLTLFRPDVMIVTALSAGSLLISRSRLC